ncbi:leucine-rich repeat extensin-like protein 2 [Senna tora]|uniref:Leucine-rich repeat extensin-like protein 2 n=1 Tax=Senna tora TaxID=362788 RepID=A0A834XD24_9FABA|nr:leucine-rich repeat extensin-like protein 2 [Senna tora]
MENYSYPSYPDSHDSSPRSREIDFENPPPWDDQQPPPNYKAKFMCSYGGKIQPRTHDNQLSYVGGETKILAVDRNVKFSAIISKLSAICDGADVTFKYQLPGEDLDALISVTNDDDLEHMMHEYDRLIRASAKPARMRLFLFNANNPPDPVKPAPVSGHNVDYLFGLDKGVVPHHQPPPVAVKFHDPVPEPTAPPPLQPPEYQVREGLNPSDPTEIQRQLQQEMQRFQISDHDQSGYRRKSENNLVGGYTAAGDYYVQKLPERPPPSSFPAAAPPAGSYWPEKHLSGEGFPVTVTNAPGPFYQAQMVRPAHPTPQAATQGYYTVQRMNSDGYREQQVYGGAPPQKLPFSSAPPPTMAPAQQKPSTYTEGYGVARAAGGIPDSTTGAYAQVSYDHGGGGRQVYYTAQGGVVHAPPPYQGVAPPVTADMRPGGVSLGQDVKVVNKGSQGSV